MLDLTAGKCHSACRFSSTAACEQSTGDRRFSVGVLLAFVQKCPTCCKMFSVPGSCWLSARIIPSHCENQKQKALPVSVCCHRKVASPALDTSIYCNRDTWGKVPIPKYLLYCLAFFWPPSFSNLLIWWSWNIPLLQKGDYQAAFPIAVDSGHSVLVRSFLGTSEEILHEANFCSSLHTFTSEQDPGHSPYQYHRNWLLQDLNTMTVTPSDPHEQNRWSVEVTIGFYLVTL